MNDALSHWDEFPKIGLTVNGSKRYYSLAEAVPLWDSGWGEITDTGEVLEKDSTVRNMTDAENRAFQERADEYSANK